jgi:hypothetical protein
MVFNAKEFKANLHFEELAAWWKFWRWTNHPVPGMLSDIGYVVELDGVNICAGWLYTTNSLIGSMEFIVSNPHVEAALRSQALDFLIEQLSKRNTKEGKRVFMTSIKNEALAKKLIKLGFTMGDSGIKQFVKV